MSRGNSANSNDCVTGGINVPPTEMARYSTQTDQFAANDIMDYVHGQAKGETAEHLELVKSELVNGRHYDVWDVITDQTRWWVITNPTNVYSREYFPSLDYTISFHIGLMLRVLERAKAEPDEDMVSFQGLLRRQEDIFAKFEQAQEPEEFQQVGLLMREQLLSITATLSQFVPLREDLPPPKKGDFKAWVAALAASTAPSEANAALRKFIRGSADSIWELVNWITRDRNADKGASFIAVRAVDTFLDLMVLLYRRQEFAIHESCPVCASRSVREHYDVLLPPESASFRSCPRCGWTDHPGEPEEAQ